MFGARDSISVRAGSRRAAFGLGLALLSVWTVAAQPAAPDYRNPRLPIEQRVADLLPRMTLEEKIALMELRNREHYWIFDPTGTFTQEAADRAFTRMFDIDFKLSPHDGANLRNAAQRYLVEKTRLGIPAIFWDDAPHGFMSDGATMFPQAITLASTWDPALVRRVFTAVADEMSAAGVRQAFTPLLDLARDPRWGRIDETYGEDPWLTSRIGVAAVQGLQGTGFLIDQHHVIATVKHFAAYGHGEGGTNAAPANYSERLIRETFLPPFRAAIQEAHAGSVMASYNEVDGVPVHVNPWLLDKVLRQEWGFRGFVTSDGEGLQMLYLLHHVAEDSADAARQGLAAGIDVDLGKGDVYPTLLAQVKAGLVPEWQIDRAVSRILHNIFRMGLFENPYADPDSAQRITGSSEHQRLAQEAAEKGMVLLKNEGRFLPLDLTKLKTIAVIGPNAADVYLGGYSREPLHSVSILDGIRARAGNSAKVVYAEGCRITEGKQGWTGWYRDEVVLPDDASQQKRIREATETARHADVAIVVVGENESTNRETWGNHPGDRDSLDLIGHQDQLIKAIVETGTPTVVLLINGRPLSINYAAEHVPAILEGWYLGQEGGTAAARVLFGDVNPGGKLPLPFRLPWARFPSTTITGSR